LFSFGSLVLAVACGGTTASPGNGPDGGGSSSGSGSGSGGTTSSSGGGSGSSSGTGSSSGSSGDDGGVIVNEAGVPTVPGNTFPCGTNVCNAPDVCCEGAGNTNPPCEAASACTGVAVACTATTCPSGSVCCGTLKNGGGHLSGSTECQAATTCAEGTTQLCTTQADCPQGDTCVPLGGGAGGGGGTTVRVCEPLPGGGDAGPPHFDGGFPVDAGPIPVLDAGKD
jgi:hypothetical protein